MNVFFNAKDADFVNRIKNEEIGIIVYGAGVIGKISAPEYLLSREFQNRILLWVDGDNRKRGTEIIVGERKLYVESPLEISHIKEPYIVLVTSSRYSGILDYLKTQSFSSNLDVYILPMIMCSDNESVKIDLAVDNNDEIPAIIHYCWFGEDMPSDMKRNIESWKHCCPDYEVMCWNEKNYDVNKYSFTKQAYESKKLAFLSDIVKLDVLFDHGGFYFDTDVELLRSLDSLRTLKSFCCVEKWGVINFGGGSGTVPGASILQEIKEYRFKSPLFYDDGTMNNESSGYFESMPFILRGFRPNNRYQLIDGFSILPSDFFHPYDYMTKELSITHNTYGIHHFYGSWI